MTHKVYEVFVDGYTIYGDDVTELLTLLEEKIKIMEVEDVEHIRITHMMMDDDEYNEMTEFNGF